MIATLFDLALERIRIAMGGQMPVTPEVLKTGSQHRRVSAEVVMAVPVQFGWIKSWFPDIPQLIVILRGLP